MSVGVLICLVCLFLVAFSLLVFVLIGGGFAWSLFTVLYLVVGVLILCLCLLVLAYCGCLLLIFVAAVCFVI